MLLPVQQRRSLVPKWTLRTEVSFLRGRLGRIGEEEISIFVVYAVGDM
jgi:hypothetical protein